MKGNFHVRFLGEGRRGNTPPLPDNQTSQFWVNVYLHGLDLFVKHGPSASFRAGLSAGSFQDTLKAGLRCRCYLRYCDDFLLFAGDKPSLHRWRREIADYLVSLRLKIHPRKTVVYPVAQGIPFLGFLVFRSHRRLRQANGIHFQRRLKRKLQEYAAGELSREKLDASVQGWIAHAEHGDTWGLRRSILRRATIPRVERRT